LSLPFTTEEFFAVFKIYNETFFPLQVAFYVFAFVCVYLIISKNKNVNLIISISLSFFWLWMGLVYHIIFFSVINPAAYIFGALFIVQGFLFFIYGVWTKSLFFTFRNDLPNYIAIFFLLYALVIYPVLGHQLNHIYPKSPTFGLPCPTTIFTFSLLLFSNRRIPLFLLIIPLLWSFIGFTAALNLTIYEDIGLLVAGLVSTAVIIITNKKFTTN
jgi:hypothetical protein